MTFFDKMEKEYYDNDLSDSTDEFYDDKRLNWIKSKIREVVMEYDRLSETGKNAQMIDNEFGFKEPYPTCMGVRKEALAQFDIKEE